MNFINFQHVKIEMHKLCSVHDEYDIYNLYIYISAVFSLDPAIFSQTSILGRFAPIFYFNF